MKTLYQKEKVCLYAFFAVLLLCNRVYSQELDITLALTATDATCVSNGTIRVALSGSDVDNIKQEDMQFRVTGTQIHDWAHYEDNTIANLPAGTYTISLRAFLKTGSEWVVAGNTATVELKSTYKAMNAVLGTTRKTLNCVHSGMIPVTIESNTGSPPFVVTITDGPASYTGTTIFTSSSGYFEIDSLAAGDYVLSVSDACSYTRTINATVGTMARDYHTGMFYSYLYSAQHTQSCDVVGITGSNTGMSGDDLYYFRNYVERYFDVGIQINGNGLIEWLPGDTLKDRTFDYALPYSLKTFRDNKDYLTMYIRVKGTSGCEHRITNVRLLTPSATFEYYDLKCDDFSFSCRINNSSGRVFCLPYKWKIVRKGGTNEVIQESSGWINDKSDTIYATGIPYGCEIEFTDSEGYSWAIDLKSSLPPIHISIADSHCEGLGVTDHIFHASMSLSLYETDTMPAGTSIKFISGPSEPIHKEVVLQKGVDYFYPFSSNFEVSEFKYINPGEYVFEYTLPGENCSTTEGRTYFSAKMIKTAFSYETKETCKGLYVIPSGQLGEIDAFGDTINTTTYFAISSVVPSSIPVDKTPVPQGDSLFFPSTGRYIIGMTSASHSNSCFAVSDTIDYVRTPFSLDPDMTAAYVCQGGGVGFIRVAGMGGSGQYTYELYDNGNKIATNNDGKFNYGSAGNSYVIRLIDTDPECAASYDQEVRMINLDVAQIAYTDSPTNTYCLGDSVGLKCLTLGETVYEWSGPGITDANKNQQNPILASSDIGIGTHTYIVRVTPEGCGQQMEKSLTLYIGSCEGAQDDYVTLFVNTTDTIDVLANDGFPSSCAATVEPIIISSSRNGSSKVVNKKIVYTPKPGFIGQDSLTYGVMCGTNRIGKVHIRVIGYPDNVVDADCYIAPPASVWSIKEAQSIGTSVSTYLPPLVGDLDGNGYPDVVIGSRMNRTPGGTISGWWSNHISEHISVFRGPNHATSVTEFRTKHPYYPIMPGVMAIGRILLGGVEKGIIVVAEGDHILRAYDMGGSLLWESSESWTDESLVLSETSIAFADFNNDGKAEIYSGNRIFDAETGRLLCRGTANSGLSTHHDQTPGHASPVTFTIAADVYGDSRPELIAGNQVYEVAYDFSSMAVVKQVSPPVCIEEPGLTIPGDGLTQVVDINDDGSLDVIVEKWVEEGKQLIYVWNPETETVLAQKLLTNSNHIGIPFIGDIDGEKSADGDRYPEILLIGSNFKNGSDTPDPNYNRLFAFKYNGTMLLNEFWTLKHSDNSGLTGLVLFDFNQDGIAEIVYRDETHLRIINGSLKSHITGNDTTAVYNLAAFENTSGTGYEYPVVADADADGSAEILIGGNTTTFAYEGALKIYKSAGSPWAPARKVWNQYAYNVVNVNEDLTIPAIQLNPLTRFPGDDGILGTADDVRPYNNFLQQQTSLNKNGTTLWPAPDIYPDASISEFSVSGDSAIIKIAVINKGDVAMGAPRYVSIYKENVSALNYIKTDSADIIILPGDTGYIYASIPNLSSYPELNFVARLNDNGHVFPFQEECDITNNEMTFRNPGISQLMRKDATLMLMPPFKHNGFYANPVSVLFNENIQYEITAKNISQSIATVVIRDTLPPYLKYVSGSAEPTHATVSIGVGMPPRDVITWTLTGIAADADTTVRFMATPESGACASQPLYINSAWVIINNTIVTETGNKTYHQGAGIGVATFSTGIGGQIYYAEPQALDYKTCARRGILIVPDEGYRFSGWSHEEYLSLRGEPIEARNAIMHYDTLTVYGNVELRAHFEPKASVADNEEACIEDTEAMDNKIWTAGDELYIRTSEAGCIVRIYTIEGVLQKVRAELPAGETKMKLPKGLYIVTLDNNIGKKVRIE